MKTKLFIFAMLASVASSATVTVTPLSTDYAAKKVTFKVAWTTAVNNRIWVWVDFCSVPGTSPGTFEKAEIGGATATVGSILTVSGNTRGFYVITNPSTVTATLGNATGQFNWCAYGSDYPPNILDCINGTCTLRGTPPFTLKDASSATQTVLGTTVVQSSLTITTPITMTDETGYPGYFCKYVGMDLHMNASYPCQQRTSDAKNWEAYIKDSRDNQIYRITQFSDGSWWFADDLATADKSVGTCNGKRYYNGNNKPSCPSGWQLPTANQLIDRYPIATNTDPYDAKILYGCYYGLSSRTCGYNGCNDCGVRTDMVVADAINSIYNTNITGPWGWNCTGGATANTGIAGRARCVRDL